MRRRWHEVETGPQLEIQNNQKSKRRRNANSYPTRTIRQCGIDATRDSTGIHCLYRLPGPSSLPALCSRCLHVQLENSRQNQLGAAKNCLRDMTYRANLMTRNKYQNIQGRRHTTSPPQRSQISPHVGVL